MPYIYIYNYIIYIIIYILCKYVNIYIYIKYNIERSGEIKSKK